MNYRDALAWLYASQVFGIKLGLENAQRLMEAVGSPHKKMRIVHVAGTNGKGSTCAMMGSILRESGVRSGVYTSPHLRDFRERIEVDGEKISEAGVAAGLGLLREKVEGWGHAPTFFELATALAAWWFEQQGVEVAIWETGMGGRLDATNVVTPIVSVITPVSMDHQEWLGGTLAKIAEEKAGIIKRGVPVVSALQAEEVRRVLKAKAEEVGAELIFVEGEWNEGRVGLAGGHQRRNAALAVAALEAAKLGSDKQARARGLERVKWSARFHRCAGDLIIDGAHNVGAAEVLVTTWREEFAEEKAQLIFGALRDKDVRGVLKILREIAEEIWLVSVKNERTSNKEEMIEWAKLAGFKQIHWEEDAAKALDAARDGKGRRLVAGSLFLAGEILEIVDSEKISAEH